MTALRHAVGVSATRPFPPARAWLLAGLLADCSRSAPPATHRSVQTGSIPAATADLRLAYEIIGSGPDTALVLHGGPGLSSGSVRGALDALSPRWTFILYDQRGRGRSTAVADSAALTVAQDVADLDDVRTRFHLERVTLVAHHWGAILAALYAKAHPDRVKRLLLLSPTFPSSGFLFWASTLPNDEPATQEYLGALKAGEDTAHPLQFCRRYWGFAFSPVEVTDPGLLARLSGDMCDAPLAALRDAARITHLVAHSLHGFSLKDTLGSIAVPILVVQGRGDTASLAAGHAWAEWSRDGRQLVLPGPGLFPWLGDPRRYRVAVELFFAGAWPQHAVRPVPSADTQRAAR